MANLRKTKSPRRNSGRLRPPTARRDTDETSTGNGGGNTKSELVPPRRSRSRDRRMSMSILDSVFRRGRRRQSSFAVDQPASDSEAAAVTKAAGNYALKQGPKQFGKTRNR